MTFNYGTIFLIQNIYDKLMYFYERTLLAISELAKKLRLRKC